MSRMTSRLLLLPVLVAALLLGFSTSASAHDELISTTPTTKSTGPAPVAVSLKFSASVLKVGTEVQVKGPAGSANDGDVVIAGPVVSQKLKSGLPNGAYTVLWRITSQDGHPVSGSYTFTVIGAASSTAVPLNPATATSSSANSSSATSSSTSSPTVPAQQVPTNKTNNEPWVIVGLVALAAAVIGAGVVISRSRLRDDA